MTCEEFWNTMPELAEGPEGDLAEDEAPAHLRGCPSCAAAFENQRALSRGLRGVAAEWERVKAPGRIEAKLLAEFRGQAGLAAPAPTRWKWSPVFAWVAAAAVVGAALLMFVVRERQQPRTPRAPAAVTEMAGIQWTAGLPADESMEEAQSAALGDFIPLPNADRLPPNEDLNLVRVEVPRSAMIALGYAVTADRAQERVRADVVLGSDGLARAVRFLDE